MARSAAGDPAPDAPAVELDAGALHASVTSPVLTTMTFLNEITYRYPDAVSFAPGRPYEGFFAADEIPRLVQAYIDHLRDSGKSEDEVRTALFQYGPTAGQIRELVARMLRVDEDIDVPPESVVVTVGCQEAVLLVLRALCRDPDDVVLVDNPCYVGVTGAARLLEIPVVAVPGTGTGVDLGELERTVAELTARGKRVRALYVVPDCSNPTGVSMERADREALLETARRLDLLLLEDNPYGLFSSRRLPTLKSLDERQQVVYLGSFAKSAFPGARVGYVVADQRVTGAGLLAAELAKIKSMITVNTPSVSQAVIGAMLLSGDGGLREANTVAAKHYQDMMGRIRDGLEREFPSADRTRSQVSWNRPDGGFFLSLDVPFEADDAALDVSAREFGVLWTPMRYFHLGHDGDRQIRLSCSYLTAEQVDEGITRLAAMIRHLSA
ncbi:PLP-dependent aminotransferase family protein [Streptomyces kanamyceticus]|uniref:PLP-dependent aminotransferase family protein n=1 Tax=Streptomyces kanamyceticus TaxID=1967 RepID=A0A5J6G6N3_STRKN|nr:PLP-dependent aminotransferase family protein [Streptomyces kanamyceticus]QEU91129.1 PLP-dependent aminotransferase family protein [Streptomyces kanamyceticus]